MSREETFAQLPEDTMLLVNRVCNRFEQTWQTGERPRLETFIADLSDRQRRAALQELIPLEVEYRRLAGETVVSADYQGRFPDLDGSWLAGLCQTESPDLKPAPPPVALPPSGAPAKPRKTQRLGDYELLAKLGAGGMGTVYKALHRRMHRVVALKVLRADLKNKPDLQARFEREVRTAARLTHPNIVTAHDAREDKGFHYLITEFVDGHDLDRLVKQQGPMSPPQAMNYILQAARGLAYAHQRQVIHRDIKPANLLVDRSGILKILDMGLARLADESEWPSSLNPTLTASGMIMGTAAFMAPEQARDTRNADERSDVYALGCTLYFLLMGKPPYSGATAVEMILAHTNDPIPSLTRSGRGEPIPEPLQALFRRMVAKRADDRCQQMTEVVETLENMLQTAPTTTDNDSLTIVRRTPTPRAAPKSAKPLVKALLIAVPASLLIGGIALMDWVTFRRGDQPQSNPTPAPAVAGTSSTPAPPVTSSPIAPAAAAAALRYGLSFNGQNSYVAVPSLQLERNLPVTLEAWVLVRSQRVANVLSWLGPDWIALFQSGDGNWGIGRRLGDDSRLAVAKNELIALERWTHLAATIEGEKLALFVNGQRVPIDPVQYPMPETQGGLYVGGVRPDLLPADQNDRFFDGLIDAVRISRGIRYRTPFSPSRDLANDDSTLALFNLDAGTGNLMVDDSNRGHRGEIVNASWVRLPP